MAVVRKEKNITGKGHRIVWVDDRPETIEKPVDALRQRGYEVEVATPSRAEGLVAGVTDEDSTFLLDLRWRQELAEDSRYRDGKEFAQALAMERPALAIVFISDFFAEPEYSDIERDISPLAIVRRVAKQSLIHGKGVLSRRKEVMVDDLEERIDDAFREATDRRSEIDWTQRWLNEKVPQSITLEEYRSMPPAERAVAADRVRWCRQRVIDEVFRRTAAQWIVIGGHEFVVVRWGYSGEEPSDGEMEHWALEHGSVPFLFSRPVKIDAIFSGDGDGRHGAGSRQWASEGLDWAGCRGAPSYPVLAVDFPDSTDEGLRYILFDTGAGANWIDYQVFDSGGLVTGREWIHSVERDIGVGIEGLSKEARDLLNIHYADVRVRTALQDGSSSITGTVGFRAVLDWTASSFASRCHYGECEGSSQALETQLEYWCGMRSGLLSGSALESLGIGLMLNGKTRKSLIVSMDG